MIETRKFSSHGDFTIVSPFLSLSKKKESKIFVLDFPGLMDNIGNIRCARSSKVRTYTL